ncbi:MAG TPA: PA14 domain-containing protein [Sedimentisphaerales bacterium]|nr:PA14 domain-containing protein [Sedimentisphaerales bacterium]
MNRRLTGLAAVCALLLAAGGAGAQELGKGKVLFEYWFGGGINNNVDTLKADARFPNNPGQSEWRDGMDRPDWAGQDYWGARGRAFLTPPETGDYTFWTASDDDSELWLSTDDNPANAKMIANVEGWCNYQNWTGAGQAPGPNRKSAPVSLVAGQKYYIELLFSDGTGGGHASIGWAGPGLGDTPKVLKGDVLTAFIRNPEPLLKAQNPDPANGAVDVTNPLFTWKAGVNAVSHEVYVGNDPVLGPNDLVAASALNMYYHLAGLTPAAKYYWRVDEIDAAGNKYEGAVWSFTVQPIQAYNLSPYDGALFRALDTQLTWKAGSTAMSHDVYLSTSLEDVNAGAEAAFQGNQTGTTFAPAALELGTVYYWRVDEVDTAGEKILGDVLTFSTIQEGMGGATFEVWSNIDGGAITALTGNENFPRNPTEILTVANMEAPTDYADAFGGRISAWLHVPVAGEYTFWVASDDDSQLFLGADKNSAKMIASVSGWTGSRAWDSMASQKSAAIQLNEGVYYIAALYKEGGGGDNCSVAWQGPAVPVRELVLDGFITPFVGLWADDPSPADGAQGQPDRPVLDWMAGVGAIEHAVYLSTDKNAVANSAAGDLKVRTADTSYVPSALNWNTTYYWKVDETDADGNVWPGFVWSFKVADYIPVVDDAISVTYDNTADPFITELALEYAGPQDWTKNGVTSLQLDLKGSAPKMSVSGGTIALMAAGVDIWNNADEFRYAYKTLNGDATMIARVVSRGTGSNEWAKGGVMIRQSTEAGSTHAYMPITGGGGNGASFQGRLAANGGSSNSDSGTAVAPPYWVKIERVGNTFNGFISADGAEWKQLGTWTIEMADPVLIGLAVTSHASGELRTFTFDSISTTGDVTGDWTVADIGVAQGGNDPAPVYVALTDSAGKTAVVKHADNPNVTMKTDWLTWKILTSRFSGVNLKAITKVTLGVGDGNAGGVGILQVANVRVVKPITINVVNPSFEQPNATKNMLFPANAIRFEHVPGWKTDKAPANSSIRKGIKPTAGDWAAFLFGGDPSIWQVTGHTIVDGEAFTLTLDASVSLGAVRDNRANLRMSFFYDDGGKRVTVATSDVVLAGHPHTYTLSFSSLDKRAAIGRKLGVELSNLLDNGISVDNVRLTTK